MNISLHMNYSFSNNIKQALKTVDVTKNLSQLSAFEWKETQYSIRSFVS